MACHGEVEGTGIGIRKLVLLVLALAFARCMTDKLFTLVFFFFNKIALKILVLLVLEGCCEN